MLKGKENVIEIYDDEGSFGLEETISGCSGEESSEASSP